MELNTETLKGVEIMDVPAWTGQGYTSAELDGMVAAFDELRGTLDPPAVKFEGSSAGSISRIYRSGTKVLADITRVPKKIADRIDAGAYRKVSTEILTGANVDGKTFAKLLAGVTFHDGALPATRAVDASVGLTHRSITYAARSAPQEEREMPATIGATGIHAAIGAVGLSRDASADEVVRRVTRIETAPRESLTQTDRDSMVAVRRAFGLAANAEGAEVLAALHAKLTYARSGGRTKLVFQDRHSDSASRADMSIAKPILKALGLPADAGPGAVLEKIQAIEDARKLAETEKTNEAHALEQLRLLLGLDACATDDDVVAAIRETLQSPAVIDAAVLSRKLTPSLRGWAEDFAAKQGVAALRTFVATAGPYNVGSDAILSDLAAERVRWSRGRVSFSAAMTEVARAHPEVTRGYLARRWS